MKTKVELEFAKHTSLNKDDIVVCIDNSRHKNLTLGKKYKVVDMKLSHKPVSPTLRLGEKRETNIEAYLEIYTDSNTLEFLKAERFMALKEYRTKKLNRLIYGR